MYSPCSTKPTLEISTGQLQEGEFPCEKEGKGTDMIVEPTKSRIDERIS
jgi:hypothetical protein